MAVLSAAATAASCAPIAFNDDAVVVRHLLGHIRFRLRESHKRFADWAELALHGRLEHVAARVVSKVRSEQQPTINPAARRRSNGYFLAPLSVADSAFHHSRSVTSAAACRPLAVVLLMRAQGTQAPRQTIVVQALL